MLFKKVGGTRKEASLTSGRLHNTYRAVQGLHTNENLPVILLCEISSRFEFGFYKIV